MAIALRTGSAVAWTTGTTIVSASMSLTAGDLIICACVGNPSSLNVTYSKTAGTGAIGSFTHRTKITSGSQGLTMGYASVTTTGTVTITATLSSTVTNGCLAIEAYSGASGVKGGTGGTGSSGTTATLAITDTYDNSWQAMAVSLIGNNPSVPTSGTNCTVERSVASNITGTTNDLAIGLGAHEAATAPGSISLTMGKGNNVAYCADIIELVQQWTVSASAGAAGSQARVASSVKSVTVTESASAAKVASSVKSVTETMSASSAQVGGMQKAVTVTESAAATEAVLTNFRSVTVTASASKTLVASSIRAALATASAVAATQVPTNKFSGAVARMSASAVAVIESGGIAGGVHSLVIPPYFHRSWT